MGVKAFGWGHFSVCDVMCAHVYVCLKMSDCACAGEWVCVWVHRLGLSARQC